MRNAGGQEKLMKEPVVGCVKKRLDRNRVFSLDAEFFSIPVTDMDTQIKYVLLKLDPDIK